MYQHQMLLLLEAGEMDHRSYRPTAPLLRAFFAAPVPSRQEMLVLTGCSRAGLEQQGQNHL